MANFILMGPANFAINYCLASTESAARNIRYVACTLECCEGGSGFIWIGREYLILVRTRFSQCSLIFMQPQLGFNSGSLIAGIGELRQWFMPDRTGMHVDLKHACNIYRPLGSCQPSRGPVSKFAHGSTYNIIVYTHHVCWSEHLCQVTISCSTTGESKMWCSSDTKMLFRSNDGGAVPDKDGGSF